MNPLARLLLRHPAIGWLAVLAAALLGAALAYRGDLATRQSQRLQALALDARRSADAVLQHTLDGKVMNAAGLLGLIDTAIKQEALGATEPDQGPVITLLGKVGRAVDAQCLFVVGEDGLVRSFWDRDGESSSGADLQTRPYFRAAIRGQRSVYAGVSLAHAEHRMLFLAAPIYSEVAVGTVGSGAVVACVDVKPLEQLLAGSALDALLVSPQGVVYASNRARWLAALAGAPTQQRLADIRALRQFGNFFGYGTPRTLPLALDNGLAELEARRVAVASSPVRWNDPAGDWRLVLVEDLAQTVPTGPALTRAIGAAALLLLLGWMSLRLLHSRQRQLRTNQRLQDYAEQQRADLRYRAELASASVRLQNCDRVDDLAATFLREARALLGALQGTLYVISVRDGEATLTLAGQSAGAEPPPPQLALGQGLLGQCAQERRTRVVDTPVEAQWLLRSGLGEAPPAALLLVPIVLRDTLLGALELALPERPEPQTLARCEELVLILANILRRHLDLSNVPAPTRNDDDLTAEPA